ncbi:hypothetical protein IAQ61_003473 [Plenodomus lingam]|uniref:NAP family protein n=1 Tax=Leptosphaeria maculans (strain JN3 / isolate v23.1.3 / race Av1-4-5-6-7-8) TaxID=985895 RepID=E5AEM7_LEPMJ|nr:hypothetical protein LEMA_P004530.1 [Plenodomus lingam JN3]KAH9876008.1 hypothetical protein IAQ61_003473 [Plenodomus lingam]CBY01666.1 hypothetical protein LEMA_P004530.1 [Plenodomus lingam JN3]
MADTEAPEELTARFEELGALEAEFEDAELEIIRKAEEIHAPLYKKRAEYIAKIPHFWSLVLEQAPQEIDTFIQPTDSKVFAECLDTLEVSRFELDDPKGSPRSFSLKFGFKDNDYFEDQVLEKKFWFRKTRDWAGLVSEPVKINWKKGKDLTAGLSEAAYKLGEMRKKNAIDTSSAEARKKETETEEYKQLTEKIQTVTDASVSFFCLFSFVSGFRWVSAEENEKTIKEDNERLEKIRRGEKVEDDDEDDEEDDVDYQESEVFPGGDEVATLIAEDMWPNAIKYYKGTFEEADDEDLSDLDEIMDDSDDDDRVQEVESDDDDNEEVDIRALVGKGRKSTQEPPAKKQRKA